MPHHEIFLDIPPWHGISEPGFTYNFIGVKTRVDFLDIDMYPSLKESYKIQECFPGLPTFDEEYFEWIDLLESVKKAKSGFTMIELGAGYGRWVVNAAAALRLLNPVPCTLIAVEAEPDHFTMLNHHFSDNKLNAEDHVLLNKAIAVSDEPVKFWTGESRVWYGQEIDHTAEDPLSVMGKIKMGYRKFFGRMGILPVYEMNKTSVWIPGITLSSILADYEKIDFIDMDIQGEEFKIINQSLENLNEKVEKMHIGTHSSEVESHLETLLKAEGWENLNNYHCNQWNDTPFGKIFFQDGVQTWINPRIN